MKRQHSMPFGAECCPDGRVRFRLWAPKASLVHLCVGTVATPMPPCGDGWYQIVTDRARPGSLYKFQIDDGMQVPDPASRFQPYDVHGPSQVIAATAFDWSDEHWRGRPWEEVVIYELHVGAFTPEGTFAALEKRLDHLVGLGASAVELMPVGDFPGQHDWGYDGVFPFAPDSRYGQPEDLKRLVQCAHEKGLMVFLDVVYNHFGPEGNYLRVYAPQFFTDRHHTPWGEAINFDGAMSRQVRDFFIHNALFWLTEYHLDGLRLDAVHAILDDSTPDIVTELAETVRRTLGCDRFLHLILENDDNAAHYLDDRRGGCARMYNAQWNDDIHHALHVALTGESDGYYVDFVEKPIERLGRCLAEGFDYQGESSVFRGGAKRGEPSRTLPPAAFVSFLQNHDQIGNRAFGERLVQLADTRAIQAAMAILLLAPSPPLLFMGEEFGADTPFLFFCDFGPDLAAAVTEGRRNEFSRFRRFKDPSERSRIPDPNQESTFQRSKLDWASLQDSEHRAWLEFYRDLLNIRREKILPLLANIRKGDAGFDTFGNRGLRVCWRLNSGGELTLLANLGDQELAGEPCPSAKALYHAPEETSSALADRIIPAWGVAWFLR